MGVKYNYVFYNDLKFDWGSLCLASLPKLLAIGSKEEYVQELLRLAVKLQEGHTSIYGDNSDYSPKPLSTTAFPLNSLHRKPDTDFVPTAKNGISQIDE